MWGVFHGFLEVESLAAQRFQWKICKIPSKMIWLKQETVERSPRRTGLRGDYCKSIYNEVVRGSVLRHLQVCVSRTFSHHSTPAISFNNNNKKYIIHNNAGDAGVPDM